MFPWSGGSRQTNNVTTNFGGVGGFSSVTTAFTVLVVSGNIIFNPSVLIHNLSQQTHSNSFGVTSDFVFTTQYVSPMVREHDLLDENSLSVICSIWSHTGGKLTRWVRVMTQERDS